MTLPRDNPDLSIWAIGWEVTVHEPSSSVYRCLAVNAHPISGASHPLIEIDQRIHLMYHTFLYQMSMYVLVNQRNE